MPISLENRRKLIFGYPRLQNQFFVVFSRISILGYMMLHDSNINVAIAVSLLYWNSLYDLRKPKCIIPPLTIGWAKRVRLPDKVTGLESGRPIFFVLLGPKR